MITISKIKNNPKMAVAVIAAVSMIIFNLSRRPMESEAARNYDNWLTKVDELSRVIDSDTEKVPLISISLSSTEPDVLMNWKFSTTREYDQRAVNDRVLRLLDLVRESEILSHSRGESAEMHLVVTEQDKSFTAHFNKSDAESNLKLATLIKVFQIYVSTAQPGSIQKIQ